MNRGTKIIEKIIGKKNLEMKIICIYFAALLMIFPKE